MGALGVALLLIVVSLVFAVAAVVSGARPPVDPLQASSWADWYRQDPRSALALVVAAIGGSIGVAVGLYQLFFDRRIDRQADSIRAAVDAAGQDSAGRDAATLAGIDDIKALLANVTITRNAAGKFPGNIGLIVNARGRLCLVHDKPWPRTPLYVSYNTYARQLEVHFETGPSFPIQWVATDEMDAYLTKVDKILVIEMKDKQPVAGYETSLVQTSGHFVVARPESED